MPWYKISITAEQSISGEAFRIQNAFDPFWLSQANDPEVALFSAPCADRNVDLWVSPKLAEAAPSVLSMFGAMPCEKPDPTTPDIGTVLGQKKISFERLLAPSKEP